MRGKMMDSQAQLTNAHNNIGHQKLMSPGNTKQRLACPPMPGAGGPSDVKAGRIAEARCLFAEQGNFRE